MVVLLAAVVIGGLVWLVRRNRGGPRTDRARTDGAGPGLPDRPLGGRRVSPALMSRGRIDVRGLTKDYGGVRAVDDLSFTVEPGRVTGFLGPNGAGKTTTINSIVGLAQIASGSIAVCGYDAVRDWRAARRQIGLSPQEYNFDRYLSIRDVLIYQAG